jgi:large subunit ribosomal protein L21
LTEPYVLAKVPPLMTYAIFKTGGRQFRAEPGATVKVPTLEGEPGSTVTFDQVLLLSDGKEVQAGKPLLKGVKVTAEVVRHGLGKKIRLFRFARRTGYRRHGGHRQGFTEIKIQDVKGA